MAVLNLSVANWLLAVFPLFVLLFCLLKLKWKAHYAGTCSLAAAGLIGWTVFGGAPLLLFYASLKGLNLTLYVVLIIWSSVLLYNIIDGVGGIKTISNYLGELVAGDLQRCLMMAWCLSGMIQGVAGFGVPVAIVTPFMTAMGFSGLVAVAATLVGHAWAISFGSMAASFYTIQLVTRLEPSNLAFWMGIQFIGPTILSGLAVAHIYGGWQAVKRSWKTVLPTGTIMSLTMLAAAVFGLPHLASLYAGLAGVLVFLSLARWGKNNAGARQTTAHPKVLFALMPYLFLSMLIVLSLIPPIQNALAPYQLAASFPAVETARGHLVNAESSYAAIKLFAHPAPLISITVMATMIFYAASGIWKKEMFRATLSKTVQQCTSPTLGIAAMLMMALIMNDTGMTTMLAHGLAGVGEHIYPLLSPYIGVLGSFMTGSNTNSNVLFGNLQLTTAGALSLNIYLIAALQSVGGSLGSSIAPAKVLLGSATAGLNGKEHVIFSITVPYCMIIVLVTGVIAWLLGKVVTIF